MDSVRVVPRVFPRHPIDAAVAIGVLVTATVIGVGAARLTMLVFRWLRAPLALEGLFVLAVVIVILTVWWRRAVRCLELQDEGIRFVRHAGNPKFLTWQQIEDISPASPLDALRNSIRDETLSTVVTGQYRIKYQTGVRYFPPADPGRFEAAVREFRGAAQRDEGAVSW